MKKRQALQLIALGALGPMAAVQAQTGAYPSRPVKIVVPFPPGALTDALARMLATRLQEQWQQTVLVDNRAGASGNIGTESVFRSPGDGYTLLFTPQSTLVLSKLLTPSLHFEPEAFAPVAMVTRSTVLMLANPKVPADNVQQLMAYAKSNPGKLNFATTGPGSTAHLTNELFFYMTGTRGVNVPYQGIAPAATALIAGEVDILFDAMANSLPNVRAGRIRALGVASDRRHPALPDVPTVSEALPGFASPLWTGLVASPNTPPDIAAKISADVARALKHPDFQARFATTSGLDPVGSTPEQMRTAMADERRMWAKVIETTGLKGE